MEKTKSIKEAIGKPNMNVNTNAPATSGLNHGGSSSPSHPPAKKGGTFGSLVGKTTMNVNKG